MTRIDVRYEGDLQCEAVHGPTGTTLRSDAPPDNEGLGRTFSPTDLLAVSLGTCIATVMGIVARRHEVDLSAMRVTVVKEMTNHPVRRVARLRTVVHVPVDPPERAKVVLERAAHHCPVHASLHPEVDVPILIRWGRP